MGEFFKKIEIVRAIESTEQRSAVYRLLSFIDIGERLECAALVDGRVIVQTTSKLLSFTRQGGGWEYHFLGGQAHSVKDTEVIRILNELGERRKNARDTKEGRTPKLRLEHPAGRHPGFRKWNPLQRLNFGLL